MWSWIYLFLLLITLNHHYASGFFELENGFRHQRSHFDSKEYGTCDTGPFDTLWIKQPLDNFNKDGRTWKMRYAQNFEFFKNNGPVYIFIGGQWTMDVDDVIIRNGFMCELAMNTSGAMFIAEHRYYGKSMPRDNKKVEDLQYLSSRQAIADLKNLIIEIKSQPKFRISKVVLIGASYGAMLSAWARMMYPDLIDAALASSAPLLAKYNYYEYLETVGEDFKKFGTPGCFERIVKSHEKYTADLATPEGIEKLKEEENICEDSNLNRKDNQALFIFFKISALMMVAEHGSIDLIKSYCNTGLENYNLRYLENKLCMPVDFNDFIGFYKKEGNSWIYQLCNEFGFIKTTSSDNQPFAKTITVDVFDELCTVFYGSGFNATTIEAAVKNTNDFYGGLKPNVTRVVFTNGGLDPWHKLGVIEDLNPEAPARFMAESSHCEDLYGEGDDKLKETVETVRFAKKTIKQWIGIVD